jgi:hypothetical protein
MNNLSPTGKWIILAVIVLVAIFALWFLGGGGTGTGTAPGTSSGPNAAVSNSGSIPGGTATPAGTNAGTGATGAGAGSGAAGSGAQTGGTSGATAKLRSSITLITPVPNDVWVAETQNPIQWSKAPGVSGQIELLSATTSQLVGVILNEIGPAQTSYTWNTRDLLQSRTSPIKFTVVPGRYLIRLSFDGNDLPSITSAPLTIVANTSTIQ